MQKLVHLLFSKNYSIAVTTETNTYDLLVEGDIVIVKSAEVLVGGRLPGSAVVVIIGHVEGVLLFKSLRIDS